MVVGLNYETYKLLKKSYSLRVVANTLCVVKIVRNASGALKWLPPVTILKSLPKYQNICGHTQMGINTPDRTQTSPCIFVYFHASLTL